jgi:chitodextrinase
MDKVTRTNNRTGQLAGSLRLRKFLSVKNLMALAAVFITGAIGVSMIITSHAASVIPGFEIFCFYAKTGQIDPIVAPGGVATHMHDFAGNTSVTPTSTVASMQAGSTTCQDVDDTAGYWAPTLYYNGVAYHPDRLHAYYRWGNIPDVKNIKPLPSGLKMIGGDPKATGPQDTHIIGWNCGVQGQTQYSKPISCASGVKVVLHIFFPNCWNGKDLDSADHKSHMAYSVNGKCPSDHPVAVTRVSEDYGYDLHAIDPTKITLSSAVATGMSSVYTAHADYWQTWRPGAIEKLTADCVNVGKQCGIITKGTPSPPPPPTPTPPPMDMTPPTAPGGLASTAKTSSSVSLSWNASTDNVAVTGYKVYRGTSQIGTTTASVRTLTDSGLTANTSYVYTVKATDAAGNISAASNSLTVVTSAAAGDTTKPTVSLTAPANGSTIAVTDAVFNVTLSATASDNVGVTKVEFYDGTTLLGPDLTSPYSIVKSSNSFTAGIHSLTAKVYDAAGNTATSAVVSVTVTVTPLPGTGNGDVNGDGRVNAIDLSALISHDGQNYAAADFNHDGTVGAADMAILLSKWTW